MFIYISIIIFCLLIGTAKAQEDPPKVKDSSITLSRSRILFGYSTVVQKDEMPTLRNIFMNVNYRASYFDQFAKPFEIRMAFEAGLNVLNFNEKDLNGIAIVPYFKIGPEMNLIKNLFVGANLGIALSVFGYFSILPYGGINFYYLLPIHRSLLIEFEFGYHTTVFLRETPYLIYFSTGVGIK